ncbi:NnrS family protein [Vogesella oryzae]|uniref:NnrS family protein n=1 Tax=Vogesella oryzae TaxID=1735285 RepID=UPI0015829DDA|nr:NnrS family protein [Vogesella oryzae]
MSRHTPLELITRAPHRTGFVPGIAAAALLTLAWAAELGLRLAGGSVATSIAVSQAHGLLMLYGIFPFFMCGFCYTAVPRWLNVDAPAARSFVTMPLLLLAGVLCWLVGLRLGSSWLLAGTAAQLAAFSGLIATLGAMIRRSTVADKQHARWVVAGFALAATGLIFALLWLSGLLANGWWWTRHIALYGFLLPVFLTVTHRMLPFFSSSVLKPYTVWRPYWLLQLWLAGSVLHGALGIALLPQWPLDLLLAALFGYTSWRWQLRRSLAVPLLAMLHLAFAWLAPAFLLQALSGLGWISPLAGLHAITIGFFITMLVGFASRVMLGHSGRPLQASPALWRVYLLLHAVAVLRVAADIATGAANLLLAVAAILLALLFAGWLQLGTPWLLRQRVDGKEG